MQLVLTTRVIKFVVVDGSKYVSLKLKNDIQMMFDDWLFMLFRRKDCIVMNYMYINEVDKDYLSSKQCTNISLPSISK